ncbi:hypothetical protein DL1_18200 [Thioclava dalianensis]|uniref:Uncharacterized protein n=1 Tax=Thioclava dalianensis TaxID=1185766 RepID=A0A074TZR0_9RHOB|nr:hypothetical protein DL1_18200 [Thioclava dalianensis]
MPGQQFARGEVDHQRPREVSLSLPFKTRAQSVDQLSFGAVAMVGHTLNTWAHAHRSPANLPALKLEDQLHRVLLLKQRSYATVQ